MIAKHKIVIPALAYVQTNCWCLFYSSCNTCELSQIYVGDKYCVLYEGILNDISDVFDERSLKLLEFVKYARKQHEIDKCKECCFANVIDDDINDINKVCCFISFMNRLCRANNKEYML